MTLPGLDHDTATLARPGPAADAEGNPTMVLTDLGSIVGTWGSPTYRDVQRAAQGGQVVDAVFATSSDSAGIGDRLTVRGKAYEVVAAGDARLHFRLFLRSVE